MDDDNSGIVSQTLVSDLIFLLEILRYNSDSITVILSLSNMLSYDTKTL